jgi:hypothetical protein
MKYHKMSWLIAVLPSLLFAQVERSWVKTYNASGDYRDCSYAIAVDKAGCVYVTGQGFGKGTQCDFTTFKYSPNGDVIWKAVYNSPESGYDKPYDIVLDDSGYVYITGCGWGGEATFEDMVTIKYSSNGDQIWLRSYDGPAKDYDCPYAIAIDKNYNVYVIGESWGGEDTWEDIVTVKYDRHGNQQWVERYDGPDHDYDYPTTLVVDDNFNVYVTGLSMCFDTDEDFVTLKYAQPAELRKHQERQRAIEAAKEAALLEQQQQQKKGLFSFLKRGNG